MKEIEIQLTLYQLRDFRLFNKSIYFDFFFSNVRTRSKDIPTNHFMI